MILYTSNRADVFIIIFGEFYGVRLVPEVLRTSLEVSDATFLPYLGTLQHYVVIVPLGSPHVITSHYCRIYFYAFTSLRGVASGLE